MVSLKGKEAILLKEIAKLTNNDGMCFQTSIEYFRKRLSFSDSWTGFLINSLEKKGIINKDSLKLLNGEKIKYFKIKEEYFKDKKIDFSQFNLIGIYSNQNLKPNFPNPDLNPKLDQAKDENLPLGLKKKEEFQQPNQIINSKSKEVELNHEDLYKVSKKFINIFLLNELKKQLIDRELDVEILTILLKSKEKISFSEIAIKCSKSERQKIIFSQKLNGRLSVLCKENFVVKEESKNKNSYFYSLNEEFKRSFDEF